jgi:hypothetical protein
MWNLEQTERLVLRMIPVVVLVTALLLWMMSFALHPQRLSPTFAPNNSVNGAVIRK